VSLWSISSGGQVSSICDTNPDHKKSVLVVIQDGFLIVPGPKLNAM
jgi:hypothetical protein